MPPTKQPKIPDKTGETIALFARNLEEIRRWFRSARVPGPEVGHYIQTELTLSYVANALQCACEGKTWTPPTPTP